MRTTSIALRLALAGTAALLVAGCGSRPAATANNSSTANASAGLGTPMNDASAMEAASNAGMAAPTNTAASNTVETTPPPPSVGNGVESNIAGM